MSKFEDKIVSLLKKDKIKFIREKTFKDLHNGLYRYDFYLPDLNIICEANGEQHYYEVWGGRAKLLHQQENDRRKISYALANNIKMYIVPYWEKENIKTSKDIFQDKFLVKSKWHNDKKWVEYQNNRNIQK